MSLVIRRTSRGNIKTIQGQIELNIFRFIKLKDLFLGGGDLCLTSSNSYHIVSHFGWQPLPKVTKNGYRGSIINDGLETTTKNH